MRILNEMTDDILLTRLEGELDHHSAAAVRNEIDETLDAFRARYLIFCFSKVTFMDSAGIGVVMGRYNKVKGKGGIVAIVECGEYIKRILSMAGIFTIAEYCNTAEEAIALCQKKAEEQAEADMLQEK